MGLPEYIETVTVYVLLGHNYHCGPCLLGVYSNKELALIELRKREFHYSFCTVEEEIVQ